MKYKAHARLVIFTLIGIACLLTNSPAMAEEELYPSLKSHATVNHSVSAFTGASGASIPVSVPPGRNGVEPKISISYSSFGRNGWVGLGWSLEMGSIQRNTKFGLNYEDNDFVTGDSELIPWDAWGNGYFRPAIEGGYSKYYYDASANVWWVYAKDGRTMRYGSSADSRQENSRGTFKWCLDRVEDPNGNYMTITYTNDQGQVYPARIEYTGHATVAPYYFVNFHLEDRPDTEVSNISRSPVYIAKRLKTIEVGCMEGLIRAYQLTYATSENTARSVLQSVQLYGDDAFVDPYGTVSGEKPIKVAELGYKPSSAGTILDNANAFRTWSNTADYKNKKMVQLDANGDGAMDFLRWRVGGDGVISIELVTADPNSGEGFRSFNTWQHSQITGAQDFEVNVCNLNAMYNRSELTVRAGDFNGDGRADILSASDKFVGCPTAGSLKVDYRILLADSDGGYPNIQRLKLEFDQSNVPLPECEMNLALADINGDGRTDIVFSESDVKDTSTTDTYGYSGCQGANPWSTWTFFSNGDGTFSAPVYWGNVAWSGSSEGLVHYFSDFNGDGKADFMVGSDGKIVSNYDPLTPAPKIGPFGVALGNGDGTFEFHKSTDADTSPLNFGPPTTLVPNHFTFGDFNGDGLGDYATKINATTNAFWCGVNFSNGDGTFKSNIVMHNAPESLTRKLLSGDFNGDGKSDIVFYHQRDDYAMADVLFSKGDGTFLPPKRWQYGYAGSGWLYLNSTTMGDFNGDGRTDLIFHGGNQNATYWQIRLAPSIAGFEGRLERIDNAIGGYTTFEYGPVAAFGPAQLPYGMSVVTATSTTDTISNIGPTTRFEYRGGLHSTARREFRGFAEVVTTAQYGSQARTRYHQDYYRKGRMYEVDSFDSGDLYGGSPGQQLGHLSQTLELHDPESGRPVDVQDEGIFKSGFLPVRHERSLFPVIADSLTQTIENNTITLEVTESFTYDFESGSVETHTSTTSDPDVNPIIKHYKDNNYGQWLWRRVEESIEEEIDGMPKLLRKVNYKHDNRGNLTRIEQYNDQGENVVETLVPDQYGNVEKTTNARKYSTEVKEFDPETLTYPTIVESCAGEKHTVLKGWDLKYGKPDWEQDPNGTVTDYTYDAFGRSEMVQVFDKFENLKSQTESEYHLTARPAYVDQRVLEKLDGTAINTRQYMDGLGRSIQSVHSGERGQPVVSRTLYDAKGRQTYTFGPFFGNDINDKGLYEIPNDSPRTYIDQFDPRDRPIAVNTWGAGAVAFDYSGTVTKVTDPDGVSKTTIKDALGRVKQVIEDPDGKAIPTYYKYNGVGDLLKVIRPVGSPTVMTYDTLGRKRTMDDPDMGHWEYDYDPNGNLVWQKDANQKEVEFVYDCLDRLTHKNYLTPIDGVDHNVAYTYDDPSVQNGIGRLSSVTNQGQVTTAYNEYDGLGRPLKMTKTIAGDEARSTIYQYDLSGKTTFTIYPDGHEVYYDYYPGSGLLEKVRGVGEDGVEKTYATYTDYPATGKIKLETLGNKLQTEYTYDPVNSRLTNIVAAKQAGSGEKVMNKVYYYTDAGDIETITDNVHYNTRFYKYDQHRLTEEYSSNDNYTYLTPAIMDYHYDPANQPLHGVAAIDNMGGSYSFSYDNNGNMLSGPDLTYPEAPATRTIDYNTDNMPVQISHSKHGTTNYLYDGGGRRAKKRSPYGTTYYIGAHFEVKDGAKVKYIFAGNRRIAQIKDGQILYFTKDHLGSTTIVSNEIARTVEQTDYLPYGGTRGSNSLTLTSRGFTDQEHDPETGLYNYNARLYDPTIAAFITADSVVPDPDSTMGFHRYGYCFGNPMIYSDPSGHIPALGVVMIIGAVIGGGNAIIQGGDVGDVIGGALTGTAFAAMSAGAFGVAGTIAEGFKTLVAQTAVHIVTGALVGGMQAAMTGQDIGQGALTGAISAGFAKYVGNKFNIGREFEIADYAKVMALGGSSAALAAAIRGDNPFSAFGLGAAISGLAHEFNERNHTQKRAHGKLMPSQKNVEMKKVKSTNVKINPGKSLDPNLKVLPENYNINGINNATKPLSFSKSTPKWAKIFISILKGMNAASKYMNSGGGTLTINIGPPPSFYTDKLMNRVPVEAVKPEG